MRSFCSAFCLPDTHKHSVFSVFRPDQTPPACHWPTIHNIYTLTVILVCPRAGGTSRSLGIRTWPKLCRYWTHQTASQSMSYTVRFPGSCISMSSPWYPLSGSRLKQWYDGQLRRFWCLSKVHGLYLQVLRLALTWITFKRPYLPKGKHTVPTLNLFKEKIIVHFEHHTKHTNIQGYYRWLSWF